MYREAPFVDVLHSFGLIATWNEPWLSVGDVTRTQGWKLHLSAVPVEALRLLHAVVPILKEERVPFKIADSHSALVRLNDGSFGSTQIGKFVTIYPSDDDSACAIAQKLLAVTAEFSGPQIPSDLWLGGIVHTRFGAFRPVLRRNRLGQLEKKIFSEDGELVNDSYAVPAPSSRTPLMQMVKSLAAGQSAPAASSLFGPGYFLTDVLQAHAKGSVFRAIDMRERKAIGGVVIKEGRYKCCSDAHGRDIGDRLAHQFDLHAKLSPAVAVPKAIECFEASVNRYLVVEYVPGEDFSAEIAIDWRSRSRTNRLRLLRTLHAIAEALSALHERGCVHRDLKPSNIRIDPVGKVWLIDLELAHDLNAGGVPFLQGTPGYMSPQQETGDSPDYADDIYSFGCGMFHVLGGLHPKSLSLLADNGKEDALRKLLAFVPEPLVVLIIRCCAARAEDRPTACELATALAAYCQVFATNGAVATRRWFRESDEIDRALHSSCIALADDVAVDETTGLWLSHSLDKPGTRETLVSANRGVAGALYTASRLLSTGFGGARLRNRAAIAADWLMSNPVTSDSAMPGLHFGRAGIAVALSEAVHSGLLAKNPESIRCIRAALQGSLDWPDVTHGAAGQGIAALHCAELLGEPDLLQEARHCADYLLREQQIDGSWIMPAGVDGMSDQAYYGFAHGVAGIVYFLSACSAQWSDERIESAWRRGADWLIKGATLSRDASRATWSWGPGNPAVWNWWCHGAVGISLCFLALAERTREQGYADMAEKALRSVPARFRSLGLGQCHGMAGIGEVFLEAARVFGQPSWHRRASSIAHMIVQLHGASPGGGYVWCVDDTAIPTADLMVGNGGVAHFLLRLTESGRANSFPLLLKGIARTSVDRPDRNGQ